MPKPRLTYILPKYSADSVYLYGTYIPTLVLFYIEICNWQIFTVRMLMSNLQSFQVPEPVGFIKLPGLEAVLSEDNCTAARQNKISRAILLLSKNNILRSI